MTMTIRSQIPPEPELSPAAPTPSAVPVQPNPEQPALDESDQTSQGHDDDRDREGFKFPHPKLRLEIRDLNHPGASKFLGAVNAATILSDAVKNVQRLLYRSAADKHTSCPPTRSVTVILRDMGGVAYTTGTDLDSDHKEIHFSLSYIAAHIPSSPPSRLPAELTGVLTHELVHCYQWDAHGTAPGGLIEGIADWVRLNCDLSPPHWKREVKLDDPWDKGYQHTAYFLQYLEGSFGEGTVRRINERLRSTREYQEDEFWVGLLGQGVKDLWCEYCASVGGDDEDESK
ncbi:peptidase of plants and bacteria-domain-containing protein [Sordaria brevicollis]|uniref:Peptidase of plants and bacteria-domain-containing protein n=1 Tax=Sordaria brevicollis TaxID=83679 RepID=A0AAE0PI02_SORBR|nr:peptidase of plants and bacteria-domain-containing protein [Sordaria brevicollis]